MEPLLLLDIIIKLYVYTLASTQGAARFPVVERRLALEGPVDKLVQYDHIPGVYVLLEGPTGGGGQDMGAALPVECPQVGTVVDVGGHDGVPAVMSAEQNKQTSKFFLESSRVGVKSFLR